jgi:hypothetical protein
VLGVEELLDAYCALPQSAQRRAVLDLVTAMAPGKAPVLEEASD